MDYRLIVAKDCCADTNQEINAFLINSIFPQYADIISSLDIASSWASAEMIIGKCSTRSGDESATPKESDDAF